MRHDPASAAVVIMLRSLKMYGMAQAVMDLIEQGAPAFDTAMPVLSQLLKVEMAEREVRSIARRTLHPPIADVFRGHPGDGVDSCANDDRDIPATDAIDATGHSKPSACGSATIFRVSIRRDT
jgi:hypothetical protein